MDNETLLEFYQYRLFKKLGSMQQTERIAFMADLFGKRWTEVYETLIALYPSLSAPNVELTRRPLLGGRVERRVRTF